MQQTFWEYLLTECILPRLDFRKTPLTNGDGGPDHYSVNGMASDSEIGKRSRQPSKVLAGYVVDNVGVSVIQAGICK